MKKVLSLLIVLSMLFALSAAAHAANEPTISVGSAEGVAGDTVSIPVSFLGNPGICSYSLTVSYDSTVLRLDGITPNDEVGGNFAFTKKAVWYNSKDVTFSGTFLTLEFTILDGAEDGDTTVSVSYNSGDICNYNEDDVNFTVTPGKITVGDGGGDTPTPGEDDPVTGPTIKVASADASIGSSVDLDVQFLNNPGITSYTLTVVYDSTALRLDSVTPNEAGAGGQFAFAKKAVWFASRDTSFSGTFLTLSFTVLDGAENGNTDVTVSYNPGDICNYNEDDVNFAVIPGHINIKNYSVVMPGDIDGDGKVNVKDANMLKQAVVGKLNLSGTSFIAGDLNGDEKINVLDCNLIKKLITGKTI